LGLGSPASPAGSAGAFCGCAGGRYRPDTGNTDSPEINKVREKYLKSSKLNIHYHWWKLENPVKQNTVIMKDQCSLLIS